MLLTMFSTLGLLTVLAYPSLSARILMLNFQNAMITLMLGSAVVLTVFWGGWSPCMEYSYFSLHRIACFCRLELKLKYKGLDRPPSVKYSMVIFRQMATLCPYIALILI